MGARNWDLGSSREKRLSETIPATAPAEWRAHWTVVRAAAGAVAIYGLFGGAKVPAVAYLASRHFGAHASGTLYDEINTAIALGVGLGPLVANFVYDVTRPTCR